ncbi:MAG TPA: hypothetical protein VKE40_14930 [Gemmataceae bacterium]|nr:hypothetical protein [Gemmataceae bacterium]
MRLAILLLCATPTLAADRAVRFSAPMYFLPPLKAVVVTKAGGPAPGESKHEAVASVSAVKDDARVPSEGPFDVWLVPKDGKPVKVVGNLNAKDGVTELKLNEHLGVIRFDGDDQPRGTLLVTAYDDPGPELKGHVVVQTAADTRRVEMVVPPGDYAVWVLPESGARARKVVDKVRVHAGKTATAE